MLLLLFIIGAIIGSFLTAYTYRWPRGKSVKKGRSECPGCGKMIAWFDNIPLFSYVFLRGKCRNCGKHISLRYPLIEASTGILFVVITLQGQAFKGNPFCIWQDVLGWWALPYLFFVGAILVAIYFEHQLIPDSLIYALFLVTLFLIIAFRMEELYVRMFVAFAAATFFLLLHLVTQGRGMGLGDVKLVLALSLILGWPFTVAWLFLSFVVGAIVGVLLLLVGRAKLGKHIPFGPFLVVSFFVILFWGGLLVRLFLPYL